MQATQYFPPGYQTNGATAVLGASVAHPSNELSALGHASMTGTTALQVKKRKQVKNACTNCQKACKKCDDARPCPRCIKYGISDSCVDSVRKERKKGIKRGPYKRRYKTEGGGVDQPVKGETVAASQDHVSNQYNAVRQNPVAFGYPSNLNQYGQPYNQYAQIAAFHKDQMIADPYVVNSVYPAFGYPVVLPNATGPASENNGVVNHTDALANEADSEKQHTTSGSQSSPQQPQTSATGASTPPLTTTSSSPGATKDEEDLKCERLSELCTAALRQEDQASDE